MAIFVIVLLNATVKKKFLFKRIEMKYQTPFSFIFFHFFTHFRGHFQDGTNIGLMFVPSFQRLKFFHMRLICEAEYWYLYIYVPTFSVLVLVLVVSKKEGRNISIGCLLFENYCISTNTTERNVQAI